MGTEAGPRSSGSTDSCDGRDRLRVLLVAHEPAVVKQIQRQLRRGGDIVFDHVRDPGSLEVALARPWDVVLANGSDAVALVRRCAPRTPVVIVANLDCERARIEAQADACVRLDELTDLGAVVQRAIAERAERGARARAAHHDARLRALLENSRDVIGIADADGTLTYVNPAVTTMFGYGPAELVGRSFLDLVHDDDRGIVIAAMGHIMEARDRTASFEIRVTRHDGTSRWVDMSLRNLLDDPAVHGLVGNLRDITDRKQVMEALQRSERRYRQIVETTREGICMLDRDFRIEFVNHRMTELVGFSEDELIGRHIKEIVDDAERAPLAERLEERRDGVGGYSPSILIHRDGGRRYVRVESTPILDEHDVLTGVLGMMSDVSAQKRAEAEVEATKVQLLQAQKMEAVGRLAGGVAHDFNNILSVILSYAEMLLEDDACTAVRDDLEEVHQAATRGAGLTRQLLLFSRQQTLHPSIVDPGRVLRDLERMLARLLREDVALRCTVTPTAGSVSIDPGQLEQVFMNLAINARDAMPHGGKLAIEIADVTLDEHYARTHLNVAPGAYVRIAVTDTGTGIDRETLGHIFEPFFTTKEQGKGTGLGLSTVFGIVKGAGGSIWVYSEVGVGSTFRIYLPRVVSAVTTGSAGASPRALRGTETILLVEDDPQVRQVAEDILRRAGYDVLVATDVHHALALARDHDRAIHLLLSDLVMPYLSGTELANRIVALRPDISVVHMSGYTDDSVVHHGLVDHGVAFLQKPITPDLLARKVREVLDRRYSKPTSSAP